MAEYPCLAAAATSPGCAPPWVSSAAVKDSRMNLAGLEPFVDDDAAERLTKEAERMRYLREKARRKEQRDRERVAEDRIRDFDPKQGGEYFTRLQFVDLTKFDLDEESPRGPMRFADAVYKNKDDYELCEGINIFSVRITTSDVGFPIHVYGTVIARDSLDKKCVYIFHRERDQFQLINSEDESLILTGPKRGLTLIGENYVEIDLKINDQGQDKELSKGILSINGIERRHLKECELESGSLATRLSTVDVMYGVVKDAVECTIAIEIIQADFNGKVTAHTTSIPNSLLLYDSQVVGDLTGDGIGVIKLVRSIICVYVKDILMIVVQTSDVMSKHTIEFTPKINGREEEDIIVGITKMRVKVAWSIMDF
ncbi:unnamed protein product [Miscanthus lutarioriparius]|uniref:DUF6598 domain-containing protein n=1 Tax=Miscanthus lutarioriparius TaxID=422564 RepID=A0A811RKU3_9POAL|nr:unnamed protein product [Miscanthus lutarioriparius]